MSYSGLGIFEPWVDRGDWLPSYPRWAGEGEVFVLRIVPLGLKFAKARDALRLLAAVMRSFQRSFDARGVAVAPTGSDLSGAPVLVGGFVAVLDIVLTVPSSTLVGPGYVDKLAEKIASDSEAKAYFGEFAVVGLQFGQITGPTDAIMHWRSMPILWDSKIEGPNDKGAPTSSFEKPPPGSVIFGLADQAPKAPAWIVDTPGLGPNGGGGNKGGSGAGADSGSVAPYIIGGGLLALAAWAVWRKR